VDSTAKERTQKRKACAAYFFPGSLGGSDSNPEALTESVTVWSKAAILSRSARHIFPSTVMAFRTNATEVSCSETSFSLAYQLPSILKTWPAEVRERHFRVCKPLSLSELRGVFVTSEITTNFRSLYRRWHSACPFLWAVAVRYFLGLPPFFVGVFN
jgi:hypothetical protein